MSEQEPQFPSFEIHPSEREAFLAQEVRLVESQDWRGIVGLYSHPALLDGELGEDVRLRYHEALTSRLKEVSHRIEDKTERSAVWLVLGDVFSAWLGRREEAMAAYQEAFKLNQRDVRSLERARQLYMEAGNWERVVVLYELEGKVHRKLGQLDSYAEACVGRARVFSESLNNPGAALDCLLDALDVEPANEAAITALDALAGAAVIPSKIESLVTEAKGRALQGEGAEASRLYLRVARLELLREGASLASAASFAEQAATLDPANDAASALYMSLREELEATQDIQVPETPTLVQEAPEAAAAVADQAAQHLSRKDEEDEPLSYELEELEQGDEDEDIADSPTQLLTTQELDARARCLVAEEAPARATQEIDAAEIAAAAASEASEPLTVEAPAAEEAEDESERAEQPTQQLEAVSRSSGDAEDASGGAVDASGESADVSGEPTDVSGELADSSGELADSSGELTDVSGELADGPGEPTDGSVELTDGSGGLTDVSGEVAAPVAGVSAQPVSAEEFAAAQAKLKKDASDLEALRVVQRELTRRGEWAALTEQLEHSLKYLRRKEGEFEVMLDVAQVFWRELGDLEKAEYYFKRLRQNDPEQVEVLEFYEEYFERTKDWRKLHVHLLGLLQKAKDPSEERRLVRRISEVSEQHLNSPEKAIEAWKMFLGSHAGDEEARGQLRRLYQAHEKWPALVEYLKEELKGVQEAGGEPERQVALLEEIVAIYRDKISGGDMNRINTLNQLLEIDPDHRKSFEELQGLLEHNRRFSDLGTLLTTQAERAAEQGDIARAVELLTRVADLWQGKLNNVTQALPHLKRILELDPHDAATRVRLKEIYEARRDYPALYELLEQESEGLGGRALEAHLELLLGLAQDRLRDPERAVPILKQLISLRPSDLALYDKLEHILRRKESWAELVDALEKKAGQGFEDAQTVAACREAAELCEAKLHDPERAAKLWQQVLRYEPQHSTAFGRLTEIYVRASRWDDLEALYAQREVLDKYFAILHTVAREHGDDVALRRELYRRAADVARDRLGDIKRVIGSLEQLLQVSEGESRVAVARELVGWYAQAKDVAREIDMHQLLLESAADDDARFEELVRLSELESARGQAGEALRWQFEAVRLKPADEGAVALAERLAGEQGELPAFMDHLEIIADAQGEDAGLREALWRRVARLSEETGENGRAIEFYERLSKQLPEDAEILRGLERLYDAAAEHEARIGALRRLIAVLKAAGAADEEVVVELLKIAQVQAGALEQPDEARKSYREVLSLDRESMPALRGLRALEAQAGRWDDVLALLEQELELTPLGEDEARIGVQLEMARIWLEQRHDAQSALGLYRQILETQPDCEAALARVESLLADGAVAKEAALLVEPIFRDMGAPARLAGALEARLAVTEEAFEAQEILEELVPLYVDVLGDLEAAFPRAARRFELDASNEERWAELMRLAGALERYKEVEVLFSAAAPLDSDEHQERYPLLRHIAQLREERLADAEGALRAWQRLHVFEPSDMGVVEAMERLMRQLALYGELVGVLEVKSELEDDPAERVALLLEAASIKDNILEEPTEAVVLYQRVLEVSPADEQAVEALERLLWDQQRWFDLDELYAAQAQLSGEVSRRRVFQLAQAQLKVGRLKDYQGALELLEQLTTEDVSDDEPIRTLVELHEVVAQEDPAGELRREIVQELERIWRAREDELRLIEILEIRHKLSDDVFEQLALLDELAALYLSSDNAELAFQRTLSAVKHAPDELERRERLEVLGEQLDHLDQVVAGYLDAAKRAEPFAAQPLYKRAGELLQERLLLPDQAIEAWEAALAIDEMDEQCLAALQSLYTQVGDYERLVDNLSRQAAMAEPERRLALLGQIGQLEEEVLERPARAVEAYQELLNADPDSMLAVESLERLFTRQAQWVDLAEILARKASMQEADADKLATLAELARVQETRLDDVQAAIDVYQQMLYIDGAHAGALDALDRLYLADARWMDLSDILRAKLAQPAAQADDDVKTRLELRLARVLASELMSVDEALDLYLAVFERHPGEPEARAALERYVDDLSYSDRLAPVLESFYEEHALWGEQINLYSKLAEQSGDPLEKAALQHKIALVQRDRVQDIEAALDAMALAWGGDPEREDWRAELVALAEACEAWVKLAEVYEGALMQLSDPDKIKQLRVELGELYRDRLDDKIQAEEQLREALALDERDLSLYAAIESLLVGQSRWSDVVELLERRYGVFAAEPDASDLLMQIASIQDVSMEDGLAAVDTYQRVLQVAPEREDAVAELRRLLRAQARWQDLVDFLESRSYLATEEPSRWLALKSEMAVIEREELADPMRALEIYREILGQHPGHAATVAAMESLLAEEEALFQDVAMDLEQIYRAGGQWDKLIGLLQRKADLESDPFGKVELLQEIARVAEEERQDLRRAFATRAAIFKLQPETDGAREHLLRLGMRLQAWKPLVKTYEATLEEQLGMPDDLRIQCLTDLGAILEARLGELERAREVVGQILTLDPVHAAAYDTLERLNTRLSDWPALIELYRQRADAELDPTESVVWLERMASLQEDALDDMEGAIATHERILELVPDSLATQRGLERLLTRTRRWQDLADLYRRLAEQTLDGARGLELRLRLAQLLETELDEVDDALEQYSEVLRQQPAHREALRSLEGMRRDLALREGDWSAQLTQVFDMLLANYDRDKDWQHVVELLELKQAQLDDLEARVQLLLEAADLVEDHVEDRTDRFQALGILARAWCVDPTSRAVSVRIEAMAGELDGWERIIPVLLEAVEGEVDPVRQAQLLVNAGGIYLDRTFDAESALVAYEQALSADPENETAQRKLEGLYGQFELWEPLVKLLKTRLEATYDSEARTRLLLRIAHVYDQVLGQTEEAIVAYEELREQDPGALPYLDALARLYEQKEAFEPLEEVLRQKALATTDTNERLVTLKKLAMVQDSILEAPERAVETYRQILEVNEEDEQAVRALVAIYERQEAWFELIEMLTLQREFAGAVEAVNQIDFRIAKIQLDRLDQAFEALDRLTQIAQRTPSWEPAIEVLTSLLDNEQVREEAFTRLVELHTASARWAALDAVYDKRLMHLEGAIERVDALMAKAAVQETKLSAPRDAFMTYAAALKTLPTEQAARDALERLVEPLHMHELLAATYEDILEAGVDDPVTQRELHTRLGELYVDVLEQPAEAIRHMEQVLRIDSYDLQALDVLDRLYQQEQRWEELGDVLERKLTAAPPEMVNETRYRLAYLREVMFKQIIDAFELYRQVLLEQADHRGATEALERMIEEEAISMDVCDLLETAYTQTEARAKLSNLYKFRLERTEPVHERAELMRKIADIEINELGNTHQGYSFLARALREDPLDTDTERKLEALAAQHSLWEEIVTCYELILRDLQDPARIVELALKAASWAEEHLHSIDRAIPLYRAVLDREPQHPDALGALEDIARRQGSKEALEEVLRRKIDILYDPAERIATLIELGQVQIALSKWEHAIESYEQLLGMDGQNIEIMDVLCDLYDRTERWEDLARTREQQTPLIDDTEARQARLAQLGRVLSTQLAQPDRALDAWRQVLGLSPGDEEALIALEDIYEQTQRWPELSDILAQQLSTAAGPARVRPLIRLAQLHYERFSDKDQAIALFQEASALDPANKLVEDALDDLYRKEERWTDLFNLLYARLGRTEGAARADLAVAMADIAWSKLSDADTAIQYLQFALAANAEHLGALGVLESLYASRDEWAEVCKVLGQRMELVESVDQKIELTLKRAGIFADKLKDAQAAMDDYVQVLNIQPDHPTAFASLRALLERHQAWEQLYEVLSFRAASQPTAQQKATYLELAQLAEQRLGNAALRIEAMEKAYALDPADLEIVEPLLDAYISGNMFEKAEPMLAEIIATLTEKRRMKDVMRFYHLRGKLAEQKGDRAAAMEDYEAARKIDAAYIPNLFSIGRLAFQLEEWDKAINYLQTMQLHHMNIKDTRQKTEMFYYLGMARLKTGDARRAKDMFTRALGVDPDHAPTKEAMAGL
jgi:X-X-X-Leu-X-X-Gly heptad repeat protein